MLGATWLSLRYMSRLGITSSESLRYFSKSTNLAICYSGFSRSGFLGEAYRAGKSAFLSCAYDVITDWRSFDPGALARFKEILISEVDLNNTKLALELYEKDANGRLDEDGLERGSLALKFVVRVIGSEPFFAEKIDIDFAGRLFQLVDDLLDYESDIKSGDLNCLESSNRRLYLRRAELLLLDPVASAFLEDRVLAHLAQKAAEKAQSMMELTPE